MSFNSFIFILLFLPVTIMSYFFFNRINVKLGKIVLLIASFIFYMYSDKTTFVVLLLSLILNYIFSLLIFKYKKFKKIFLIIPLVINVGLLLYFKYLDFAIVNLNQLLGKEFALRNLILPLGISFFTFQQIAYVVARYNNEIENGSVLDYLTYILYFPKILMGPLMDPVDFISQLNDVSRKRINWDNFACGIKVFCYGLFKKVMIADVFAKAVAWGYANIEVATSIDWILIMLFYTFEIYFDFSGYSDMAVGSSLMLNIELPINFDSPYKALSIRDFWKRWHISLTKFFTKYIYIPLGGSKKGKILTYVNTMIVFFISGMWHGANWTFILWGIVHGAFMIFDRLFENVQKRVFEPVRWFLTFEIVNVLWLLFRSDSIVQWKEILMTIIFCQNTSVSKGLIDNFVLPESTFLNNVLKLDFFTTNIRGFWMIAYIILSLGICLVPENNYRNLKKLSVVSMFIAFVAFVWGFICLSGESVFVYFNF